MKELSGRLMYINLTTINNEKCRDEWSKIDPDLIIGSNHLCTMSPIGGGLCSGDSSGTLEANGKLIGILSFGIECGWGKPDVVSRFPSINVGLKKLLKIIKKCARTDFSLATIAIK